MKLIQGIHHISMNCAKGAEYEKVLTFYRDILRLAVVREWDGGVMLNAGGTLLEIFPNDNYVREKGAIRHFAFAVSDADACAKAVTDAGYEVFIAPKDICIASEPPLPARIAFCRGPLGEEIEFFCEK